MEFVKAVFQTILDLGPLVMMPIVLFLLGLVFGMGLKRALRSGLTVGVGFAGVYLVLDFFIGTIAEVATTLGERFGGALTYVDIGWASFAAIGWASAIGAIFIPVGILSNLVLLLLNVTKTLSVNIWDYWESIIAGVIVQTLTGSFWLGLAMATLVHCINLKVGDWTQHMMRDYFGFEGISSYAAGYAEWGLIGLPISKLLEKIPGLSQPRFTAEWLQERFGVFGEPIFIGAVIGIIMGLLAGIGVGGAFLLGVNLAAVLYIQPKMISILMEALVPISDAAKGFLEKRAPGRQVFIGLDPAIGTGDDTGLAIAIVLVPITLLLALVLPGSRVLPLADLTFLVFFTMWAAAVNKGDVVRTLITAVIFTIFAIYAGSFTAPVMNQIAQQSGMLGEEAAATVTHFANGFYPHSLIATLIGKLIGGF
jgi:PTS system galactitol-specific IIC component